MGAPKFSKKHPLEIIIKPQKRLMPPHPFASTIRGSPALLSRCTSMTCAHPQDPRPRGTDHADSDNCCSLDTRFCFCCILLLYYTGVIFSSTYYSGHAGLTRKFASLFVMLAGTSHRSKPALALPSHARFESELRLRTRQGWAPANQVGKQAARSSFLLTLPMAFRGRAAITCSLLGSW